MKYAQHFIGQAFHGAGKPENDGVGMDSPVSSETGFAPMKYAQHFMGQAFHVAGKPSTSLRAVISSNGPGND
jgi:hypothetical protein